MAKEEMGSRFELFSVLLLFLREQEEQKGFGRIGKSPFVFDLDVWLCEEDEDAVPVPKTSKAESEELVTRLKTRVDGSSPQQPSFESTKDGITYPFCIFLSGPHLRNEHIISMVHVPSFVTHRILHEITPSSIRRILLDVPVKGIYYGYRTSQGLHLLKNRLNSQVQAAKTNGLHGKHKMKKRFRNDANRL